MSASYIQNNEDKGFWIHDDYLELAVHYIHEFIKARDNNPDWLDEYNNWLLLIRNGNFPNMASLRISEYLDNQYKKDSFCGILDKTERKLDVEPYIIPVKELQEIQTLKCPEAQKEILNDFRLDDLFQIYHWLKLLIKNDFQESHLWFEPKT